MHCFRKKWHLVHIKGGKYKDVAQRELVPTGGRKNRFFFEASK